MRYGCTWQPIGDQFQWACRVCENEGSLKCLDCKCERTPAFEFDPDKYVKLCQEFSKERFEKSWCIGGMRGSGKIFQLEKMLAYMDGQLKVAKEDRDYWKKLAASMIERVNELSQLLMTRCELEDDHG